MLGRQQLASILGEVSRRDRVAFTRLYEASSRKLYAIVQRIVRRRDLADALLQEVYLRIWQQAAQFNPLRSSPMTWMATIARNCALDEARRAASRPTEDDSALLALPSDCTPSITYERTEDELRLWACLERLGPERRALVVRVYCLGLTREEIAIATGRPVATIKTWLRRTLLELRRHLDEEAGVVANAKPGQECAMIERRPFHDLSGEDIGWLKAKRHFSFDGSDDSARQGWGALRIWNDDEIAPDAGFPPHAHANMEIITYVREGVVTHRDSLGNEGQTKAGDVQVMSAGTGIRHAEYNSEPVPALIFQIWIVPDTHGGPPTWGSQLFPFPKGDHSGRFVAFASGFESDTDALPIRARARVLGARLTAGQSIEYAFGERRRAYLVPSSGTVDVNGVRIHARDGAAIKDTDVVRIKAIEDADIVMVDVS